MKLLNIAIVVGSFPTVSETFIVNQITSLIDKGHSVKIYSYEKGNIEKIHNSILTYGLLENVVYRDKPPVNKLRRLFSFLKLIFQHFFQLNWALLFKSLSFSKYGKKAISLKIFYERKFFILNKKFDVVHVHFATNAVDIANYKTEGYLHQSKLVVSFHGYDINPSKIDFYKTHYKGLFEHTDHFTVNTIYTKEILLLVNPILTNVSILPVGLDTVLFKKTKKQHEINHQFKIVYCGRLVSLKGGLLLPLIIEELLNRGYNDIYLNVIGDGELKNQLCNEIERLNLKNVIELLGDMTQDEIINVFSESDVFLLPGIRDSHDGRAEAQGLVIQEAQAMELPVVVSNVGGMKYGLIPDVTGFVVQENDISGFADRIEELIKNPQKAKKMGEEGRKFTVQNYDTKVLVDKLVSVYIK
ncbi:glycosyltransferase [Aequorivita sp. SDUM287046]|uniref:Glycosyltransferase n=1 Tax=Aequorivita aurantiaca TaxID=3053356 RepID=A0ABT8DIW9_9FLAO|nr:glycosyltransferase [Aequorivita aurantiaca]MDN3725283.1 glycosyltransferase [Aequorivita aurantiaca]